MNIFATSKCPIECAKYLDDKRVIKMCLETAQILSTITGVGYKPTHRNHPAVLWAKDNFSWTLEHFVALCNEYYLRYNKIHKSSELLKDFIENSIEDKVTPFVNCTTYKHVEDIHLAYQLYLNDKWDTDKREPTWYRS